MNALRGILSRNPPAAVCLLWNTKSGCPFHTISPLQFRINPILCAEPMKKKKRIDPAVLKAREDRKKKKIEKSIKLLGRNAQKLKPIDELVVSKKLQEELKQRTRKLPPLTEEELEERALMLKSWTLYKRYQYLAEQDKISSMLMSAESALQALRVESEELYQKAVQLEQSTLPITLKGPVSTPPIPGYAPPDGDYVNTTRKW